MKLAHWLYRVCLFGVFICNLNLMHSASEDELPTPAAPWPGWPWPQPDFLTLTQYKNKHPAGFANLVLFTKQPKKFPLKANDKTSLKNFGIDPTHPKLPALVMSIIQRK